MDARLERWINGPAGGHPALDRLMTDAATWAVPVFIGVVVAWLAVGWIRGSRRDRAGALTALLAAGGALLVNQAVLLAWARPRPFRADDAVHVLVTRSADPSFPSDHAAAAVAVAVALLLVHRRVGAVVLALALLVCVARVYVGAHYPGDVLAGAAIGTVVALLLSGPLAWVPSRLDASVRSVVRRLGVRLPTDRERSPGVVR